MSNRADMMEALYNQGEDWVTQDAIQNAVEERGVEALKEFQNIFKTAKRFLAEDIENVMKEQGIKAATPADPTLVVFTDKVANPIQLVRDVATQMKNLGAPLPVQTILENENVLIAAAARIESAFVGTSPGKWDTFKGNLFGLAGRVQLVDRLAAADKAIVEAKALANLPQLRRSRRSTSCARLTKLLKAQVNLLHTALLKLCLSNVAQAQSIVISLKAAQI